MTDNMMNFTERQAAPMNILTTYTPDEDHSAAGLGYRFLGAGWDLNGREVHLFEMKPIADYSTETDE